MAHAITTAKRYEKILQTLAIEMITVCEYPPWLLATKPLAPLLFSRGNTELLHKTGLAIVGSRNASIDSAQWAYEMAHDAAKKGLSVISGGAVGIDSAAHLGALAAKGATLVYHGVACDKIYPKNNRELFMQILKQGGALVSEYLPGEKTYASGHALRNRFIAAQAQYLIIAEADIDSGSLGTALWAKKFGVQVYVSPPGVGKRRMGLEKLVKLGQAQIIEEPVW